MAATPIIWRGYTGLTQQPESGQLTLADRVTCTDIYRGPVALCYLSVLRRGTFGGGTRLGWVVTSSKVDPERKQIGKLTVNWELGGAYANPAYAPLDEFDVQPIELCPKVERNKIFVGATYPGNPDDKISLLTLSYCYSAIHGATVEARKEALRNINNMSDATQKAWGLKLLDKLNRGIETYYQAGLRYTWTWHAFVIPANLSKGGIIQNPLGPLFGQFNANMSWLRLCDSIQSAGVNGSVFKFNSVWLGADLGHWDPELYT